MTEDLVRMATELVKQANQVHETQLELQRPASRFSSLRLMLLHNLLKAGRKKKLVGITRATSAKNLTLN